jgi:glycosyltransferase involved in cell wall biosynthesis
MPPKIIFLITEDRFLWSHRLPIATAALQNGYEVIIATRVVGDGQKIIDEGFRLIPLSLKRGSYNPLRDLGVIRHLREIYKSEKPDIVHHVAIKPVLYGTAAALGFKDIRVINALTGLGFLVSSNSAKARFLRPVIWNLFRLLLSRANQHVLLQNRDDMQLLVTRLKISSEKIVTIRGSGVNVDLFRPSPEPSGTPIVLFASRMLWIKGIREFVEAARLLRNKGVKARFVLVGDADFGSPSSVPRQQLLEWQEAGALEWWGHQQNMPDVLKQANLICLPSQGGEGVPKTLLEAAASGRAIITTNVPGCRDIVRQGVNGILVEPKNATVLAGAVEELLNDPERRRKMGERGREIAVSEFSQERVVRETLSLYDRLLKPGNGSSAMTSGRTSEI